MDKETKEAIDSLILQKAKELKRDLQYFEQVLLADPKPINEGIGIDRFYGKVKEV